MAHTPGPWKIGNCDSSIIWSGRYGATKWQSNPGDELGECVVVAVAEDPFWGKVGPLDLDAEAWDRETKANARLIAAAPDLLDACKALLELHIAHHNHPVHVTARAAIAKSEGREG